MVRIKNVLIMLMMIFILFCVSVISQADNSFVLKLNETEITIVKGKSAKLVPEIHNTDAKVKVKYSWESSDNNIATVQNGNVKAIDGGKAKIICTGTLEDGSILRAEADVIVTVPVNSIKLKDKGTITIRSGSSAKIAYEISPANASNKALEWSSDDSSIASVDNNGTVKAKKAGRVKISAVTKDGSNKKIQVTVYVPSLYCSTNSVTVNKTGGKSFELNYYGKNWHSDINISQQGNSFKYSVTTNGSSVKINILPLSTGSGSISINDKKDPQSKVKVNVTVTAEAIPISQYVLITKATCRNGNVNISMKNNSGRDIAIIDIYIVPYNQFNEIIYYGLLPGEEPRWIVNEKTFKAGNSISIATWTGNGYPDASIDHMDIAITSVRFSDGNVAAMSGNDYCYYSTKTNDYKNIKYNAINTYPGHSIMRKANTLMVGLTSGVLTHKDAIHYGFKHGGEYITEVVPNSIAARAGLKVGDLITAVDGVYYDENSYTLEIGKSKLVDGKSIEITVEKYAQEGTYTITMKK